MLVVAFGQQDAQYTQFMFNKLALNPAYAGSKHAFCTSLLYRQQWVGIEGAPVTQAFNAHGLIHKRNIGIGVSIVHDEIGLFNNWVASLIYDYQLKIGKKGKLNIGAQASLDHIRARWDQSSADQIGDFAIPEENNTLMSPNFGAGLYYHTDKFYMGLSMPKMLRSSLEFDSPQPGDNSEISTRDRHIFLMTGIMIPMSKTVKFKPAILMKYVKNSPFDFDANASFLFFDRFWAGVTYRFQDSVDGLVMYEFTRGFKIGLAYDYTLTELQNYNDGSFEVMVEYCIIPKDEAIVNPRFF